MNPSDPQRRHIKLPYGEISYTDEGQGQPVVMVHGLPGSVRDFRHLAPHLSDAMRVIRMDLPGFGDSVHPPLHQQSPRIRANYILDFIRALDLKDALLVGHSMGGALVVEVAHLSTARLAGIVLLSSVGPSPHYPVRAFQCFGKLCEQQSLYPYLLPLLQFAYVKLGFSRHLTDMDMLRSTLDAPTLDFELHKQKLATLPLPLFVAWANDDKLIPQNIFEALAQYAEPAHRLAFEKGGHNIQKTHAATIAQSIKSFMFSLT